MVKRFRAISKCRGCKKSLNEVVMGKIEIVFFSKSRPYETNQKLGCEKRSKLVIMLT